MVLSATTIGGMSGTQLAMLALAVVGLTTLLLSTRRRRPPSTERSDEGVRDRYRRLDGAAQTRHDIEAVMVELDRLARHVQGQIDTRFAKLEVVIRDADERIRALSELVPSTAARRSCDITLDAEEPHRSESDDAGPIGREPHRSVYRLADRGLHSEQIAEQTGTPIGEVELILALRKAKVRPGAPVPQP